MKRLLGIMLVIAFFLIGCGNGGLDIEVQEPPLYEDGVTYPFIITVNDGDEGVENLEIVATMEMARMDHGVIEVSFTDVGEGNYEGEVALPMGGEWITDFVIIQDGKALEETLIFDVIER